MTVLEHARSMHYNLMCLGIKPDKAKDATLVMMMEMFLMVRSLDDDNIKNEEREKYDNHANLLGYINELRKELGEL